MSIGPEMGWDRGPCLHKGAILDPARIQKGGVGMETTSSGEKGTEELEDSAFPQLPNS